MLKYPKVIGPDYLLEIGFSLPSPKLSKPLLPKQPELNIPKEPSMPLDPSSESKLGCFGIIALFIILGIVMLKLGTNIGTKGADIGIFGILLILTSIILIITMISSSQAERKKYEVEMANYFTEKNDYPAILKKVKEEYSNSLEKFNKATTEFERELVKYNDHLNEIRSPEYIHEHRRKLFLDHLKTNTIYTSNSNLFRIKKGVTEDFFIDKIKSTSSYRILENQILKFPNSENGYYPDMVIHEIDTNLIVDIEIDEPYIGATGEPIHYISSGDDKRDNYFVNNGWIVIRFAEEQIIKNTSMCLEFIDYIIKSVIEFKKTSNSRNFTELGKKYTNIETLSVDGWNKDDAHRKAFSRYRNTYLGFEFLENLSTEHQFTKKPIVSIKLSELTEEQKKALDIDA